MGLTKPPDNDFEMELGENDDGLGTFKLVFDKFKKFSKYPPDTTLCVVLMGNNQNAMFNCGKLDTLKGVKYFSLEDQRENGKGGKTGEVIIGTPSSAKVEFVSPAGKILYRWQTKGPKRKRKKGKRRNSANPGIVGHKKASNPNMESIMLINFTGKHVQEGKIVVEWNEKLAYKSLKAREKVLMSQQIMTEMLDYVILRYLTDKDGFQRDRNSGDETSLSIILDYLKYLDKTILDIFEDNEKLHYDECIVWKQETLNTYCKKGDILQKLIN